MKRKEVMGRLEAARDQVVPAAEDAVHLAAERVGPLVQQAADRIGPFAKDAADRVGPLVQAAADRVGPLAHEAAERVSPFAHAAADRAAELTGPYVERAAAVAGPYVHDAAERVSPYVHEAAERVGPYAHSAKVKGAAAAAAAVGTLGPRLDDVLERVPPVVDAARGRLNDDLLPRLTEVLSGAAASPVAVEAKKRGLATVAAVKGEVEAPRPKKKGRWLKRLALVAAIAAVVALVARKLLASDDPGWQSAKPVPTPTPPTPTPPTPTPPTATPPTPTAAPSPAAPVETVAEPVLDDASDTVETSLTTDEVAAGESADEPIGASSTGSTDGSEVEGSGEDDEGSSDVAGIPSGKNYGEGSYTGTEPPEGFTIKGNENSMKYHLPSGLGYSRTIAEVWFNSEEAAEAAGFVRAQR